MLDLSAGEVLRLIEDVFEHRSAVTAYEVRYLGRMYALGADGERGLRYLRDGLYTKEDLKRAYVEAVLEALDRRTGPAAPDTAPYSRCS